MARKLKSETDAENFLSIKWEKRFGKIAKMLKKRFKIARKIWRVAQSFALNESVFCFSLKKYFFAFAIILNECFLLLQML